MKPLPPASSSLPPAPCPLPSHEIRSPELQEVMSGIPGSFLKWGLLMFFAIIMAILLVSRFVSYPTVVTAPVTITTYNSPASLIARSTGKIEKLLAGNEEYVKNEQPVAVIENIAHFEDVEILVSFLNSLKNDLQWIDKVSQYFPPASLSIGEVQSSYLRFMTIFNQYKEYLQQGYIQSKLRLLEEQIKKQEEYTIELFVQRRLSEEDLQLEQKSFLRDSILFYRGNYPISVNEFEKSKQSLLQRQSAYSSLKASIKNNESSMLRMKESHLDLQVQLEKELHQYRMDLEESFQLLGVATEQWKEKYLIESPVDGKVTLTSYWNENQIIKAGDVLVTVIPADRSMIIVRADIPSAGVGRVRVGQEVNIKLSGFPYMEFGMIKGKIRSLSLVPANDVYIAEIDLVNGMRSTYNIDLNFISEMTGTADIITEKSRLIYRFIKPLKALGR
ncbi:MAG TPA: HlyD family efflux transporter periplasmic adaptor subunit [Bacteroidales bacterium]|jgi:multidrug efflux pump subunit AcrA (membrane-fusion protein)|nr:HlyD family efflux transporter periplasmic adaptor subunit [Bacteroidales bacterium]